MFYSSVAAIVVCSSCRPSADRDAQLREMNEDIFLLLELAGVDSVATIVVIEYSVATIAPVDPQLREMNEDFLALRASRYVFVCDPCIPLALSAILSLQRHY